MEGKRWGMYRGRQAGLESKDRQLDRQIRMPQCSVRLYAYVSVDGRREQLSAASRPHKRGDGRDMAHKRLSLSARVKVVHNHWEGCWRAGAQEKYERLGHYKIRWIFERVASRKATPREDEKPTCFQKRLSRIHGRLQGLLCMHDKNSYAHAKCA